MNRKYLLAALVVASIVGTATADSAPKAISVTLGSIYTPPIAADNLLLSGKSAIYYSNIAPMTADIQITSFDMAGVQLWQKTIDSGGDEVVTAATVDPIGNIWLTGSASLAPSVETSTSLTGIDNPDGVTLDGVDSLRPDMNNLLLWKISPSGELIATYISPQQSAPLATSISATQSGISISGILDSRPFITTASTSGIFGKISYLGSSKTIINSIVRNSDGTTSLFGSSSETLGGKKVVGKRDGVLIKVSKAGAIASVVRSSEGGSSRGWTSGDTAFLLAGYVSNSSKNEIALTKFTSTFKPSWTTRFNGVGVPLAITGGGNSYLAFTSKAAITGVSGWKPAEPTLVVLTFDGKGLLKAATSLPGLTSPLKVEYSRERGFLGLASARDGSVSIFTLVSR